MEPESVIDGPGVKGVHKVELRTFRETEAFCEKQTRSSQDFDPSCLWMSSLFVVLYARTEIEALEGFGVLFRIRKTRKGNPRFPRAAGMRICFVSSVNMRACINKYFSVICLLSRDSSSFQR